MEMPPDSHISYIEYANRGNCKDSETNNPVMSLLALKIYSTKNRKYYK